MNKKLIWSIIAISGLLVLILLWINLKPISPEAQVDLIINQEMSGDLSNKLADNILDQDLSGHWQANSLVHPDGDMIDLSVDDIFVEFDNQSINAQVCNLISANYKIVDGNNIVADGPIIQTRMACESKIMEAENIFVTVLEKGWGYVINDNVLTLISSDGWVLGLSR